MLKRGISLAILIITIMVLLVLTGAVLLTGGFTDMRMKAQETVFKSDVAAYQTAIEIANSENQIKLGVSKEKKKGINATTLEEIQAIIPEFKEEYDGILRIRNGKLVGGKEINKDNLSDEEKIYKDWLADLEIPGEGLIEDYVEVGDYVRYTPYDGDTFEEKEYQLLATKSGYTDNQLIERQEINWKVLKVEDSGVVLISETGVDDIYLKGTAGWVNGPKELDNMYKELYSGSKGNARNLNVEDVNAISGFDGEDETNWSYFTSTGAEVKMEKGVRTIAQLEAYVGQEISADKSPEAGKDLGVYLPKYYSYNLRNYATTDNSKQCALIYASNSWLSSNYIRIRFDSDGAGYLVRTIIKASSSVTGELIADSWNSKVSVNYPGRPIIILNPDIEIDKEISGDGSSATSAWILK